MKTAKCLNPNCIREARARGLCAPCHVLALRLVSSGSTSWDDLERRGRVAPPKRRYTKGTMGWLLGGRGR